MKKVLYLLIVILSISCSKNDPEPENFIFTGDPQIDEFLNGNILKNIFEEFPSYRRINDSAILFSGKLKDSQKFGFIGFNLNTKVKLFDLITFEHTSITLDLPYGETKTINVREVYIDGFFENDNSKVIHLKVGGDGYSDSIGYIYFIKDNKVTNIINPSADNGNNLCLNVVNWNKNFLFIRNTNCAFLDENTVLYTPSGDKIMTVKLLDPFFFNDSYNTHYEIINDFEAIIIKSNLLFHRIDLMEENLIWTTELDLSKLDRPQFNETKLISKTDTHFTYEISYTEYSGNKGVIKFKVNIETGEIEYL